MALVVVVEVCSARGSVYAWVCLVDRVEGCGETKPWGMVVVGVVDEVCLVGEIVRCRRFLISATLVGSASFSPSLPRHITQGFRRPVRQEREISLLIDLCYATPFKRTNLPPPTLNMACYCLVSIYKHGRFFFSRSVLDLFSLSSRGGERGVWAGPPLSCLPTPFHAMIHVCSPPIVRPKLFSSRISAFVEIRTIAVLFSFSPCSTTPYHSFSPWSRLLTYVQTITILHNIITITTTRSYTLPLLFSFSFSYL